jgi:hypothetical protein
MSHYAYKVVREYPDRDGKSILCSASAINSSVIYEKNEWAYPPIDSNQCLFVFERLDDAIAFIFKEFCGRVCVGRFHVFKCEIKEPFYSLKLANSNALIRTIQFPTGTMFTKAVKLLEEQPINFKLLTKDKA